MKPEFVTTPNREENIDGHAIVVEKIESFYGSTKYHLHLLSEDGEWPSLRTLGSRFGAYWELSGARFDYQNTHRAVLDVSGSD